jgi:predicted kinase
VAGTGTSGVEADKATLARALGRSLPAVVFCEDEWLVTLGFEVRSLAEFEAAAVNRRALIGPPSCQRNANNFQPMGGGLVKQRAVGGSWLR